MAQAKKETAQEVTGYVKVAEVAKTLDMTPQWVRDLTKKGVFKTHTVAPGERYFLPETIKAYVNYLRGACKQQGQTGRHREGRG